MKRKLDSPVDRSPKKIKLQTETPPRMGLENIKRVLNFSDLEFESETTEILPNKANSKNITPQKNTYTPSTLASPYKNNAVKRLSLFKNTSVTHQDYTKKVFYDACETGDIVTVSSYLELQLVDPSSDDNYAICTAIDNRHIEIVKLLLQHEKVDPSIETNWCLRKAFDLQLIDIVEILLQHIKVDPSFKNNWFIQTATEQGCTKTVQILLKHEKVDPCVEKNHCIRIACHNNDIDMVKLLLSDKRVNPRDNNDYCINTASQNNQTEILSLLFNDERVGIRYFQSMVRANNLLQLQLYLDYKDQISDILFFIQDIVSSNQNPELTTLLLAHDKIDLNEMFLFIREYPHSQYTSLKNQIFDQDRFNIHSLIVSCYSKQTFENPNYHGLKQELFADPKLDFSIIIKQLHLQNPFGELESIVIDLYKEKLLSFDTIIKNNLVQEPLNISYLILECYDKNLTEIENEPLVSHLINDYEINLSELFYTLYNNEEEDDTNAEQLFIELYKNKVLTLDCIVNQALLSQPILELTSLIRGFFKTRVLIEDIKFREHLLGHPRLHDYKNKDVFNIYDLFEYFYTKKIEDEFYSFDQLELFVPFVQKALQQDKEILNDYYDFIDTEEDDARKKQLIDVLIRPIYERTRFFPQAPTNSKLHLPELWKMIANNMIHHTLGTVPEDYDLNNKPK